MQRGENRVSQYYNFACVIVTIVYLNMHKYEQEGLLTKFRNKNLNIDLDTCKILCVYRIVIAMNWFYFNGMIGTSSNLPDFEQLTFLMCLA